MSAAVAMAAVLVAGPSLAKPDDNSSESATATSSTNYANSSTSGGITMEQLRALPREVSAFTVPLKAQTVRFFAGKRRVYVPSFSLMITQSGAARAYAGGSGSSDNARASEIQTTLTGITDDLGVSLAGEAYADLISRLKEAGYEVVTAPPAGSPAPIGTTAKSFSGQPLYGPSAAPLTPGMPWLKAGVTTGTTFNSLVGRGNPDGEDLIVLMPGMGIDYESLQSSGNHIYGATAQVGTRLRFHIMGFSGAWFALHSPQPYNAAWNGYFYVENGAGTDEPFAVLAQTGDKSDSRALHTGLALLGMSSRFKEKKIYEAQAEPGRFAALTRAAFQGLNASLVDQIKQAAAK